jgi:DNA-binding XRE family transcriptional regulator
VNKTPQQQEGHRHEVLSREQRKKSLYHETTAPENHDAYDYAERIRERLPRRLQELREAAGFTKYGLARESGVSREYLGKIERGKANPKLPVTAQISHGLGMTLEQFTGELEDEDDGE